MITGQKAGRWGDELLCTDISTAAAVGLLGLMAGISQDYWCSAWYSGIEYILWRVQPNTACGQEVISERQATLLHLLHEESGGWWGWHEIDGPRFFTTDDWLKHLATRKAPQ